MQSQDHGSFPQSLAALRAQPTSSSSTKPGVSAKPGDEDGADELANFRVEREEVASRLESYAENIIDRILSGSCSVSDHESEAESDEEGSNDGSDGSAAAADTERRGLTPALLKRWRQCLPVLDLLHDLASGSCARQVTT